jgi:hypothetical protein
MNYGLGQQARLKGRVPDGATDWATMESCQPSDRINAGSAPEWGVKLDAM